MAKIKAGSELTQKLIELAIEQGWLVETTKNGHILFKPVDREYGPIFTSSTPSDWRAAWNLRSRLKKAGLKVD